MDGAPVPKDPSRSEEHRTQDVRPLTTIEAMDFEARVRELGLQLPDYSVTPYYGASYGSMKSHHQVGSLLFLSGHVPELEGGGVLHPGQLGAEVTIEQGYEAARLTGVNALGGIRYALGSLDRVKAIVRSLCFVACVPDFHDVHKVSSGATDLFRDSAGQRACPSGTAPEQTGTRETIRERE